MGYYINPPDMSKEQFLSKHGISIGVDRALSHGFDGKTYPVCLVDNGMFTAAGIGYCKEEVEAFSNEDRRPKKWFMVGADALEPYYKPKK